MPTRSTLTRPVAETLTDLARAGAIKMELQRQNATLLYQAADLALGIVSSVVLRSISNLLYPELAWVVSEGLPAAGIEAGPSAPRPVPPTWDKGLSWKSA